MRTINQKTIRLEEGVIDRDELIEQLKLMGEKVYFKIKSNNLFATFESEIITGLDCGIKRQYLYCNGERIKDLV